jgi:small-conductance mechanosensitive channel
MLDLLADNGGLASELVSRTSSTLRVQEIVRLSLAPAFLLAAIGAVMNVMMSRLIWVADRIERLESRLNDETGSERAKAERDWLVQRRRLAQRAVMFSTLAALTICMVIALLFVSAFITPQIGTLTALAWIGAMGLLITSLVLLVRETMVAASWHNLQNPD